MALYSTYLKVKKLGYINLGLWVLAVRLWSVAAEESIGEIESVGIVGDEHFSCFEMTVMGGR